MATASPAKYSGSVIPDCGRRFRADRILPVADAQTAAMLLRPFRIEDLDHESVDSFGKTAGRYSAGSGSVVAQEAPPNVVLTRPGRRFGEVPETRTIALRRQVRNQPCAESAGARARSRPPGPSWLVTMAG